MRKTLTFLVSFLLVFPAATALATPREDLTGAADDSAPQSDVSTDNGAQSLPESAPLSDSEDTDPQSVLIPVNEPQARAAREIPDISVAPDPSRDPRSVWEQGREGVRRIHAGDPINTRLSLQREVFPEGATRFVLASTDVPGAAAEGAALAANIGAAFLPVGAQLGAEETAMLTSVRPTKVLSLSVSPAVTRAVRTATGRDPIALTQDQLLGVQPEVRRVVTVAPSAPDQGTAVALAARQDAILLARPLTEDTVAAITERKIAEVLTVGGKNSVEEAVLKAARRAKVVEIRGQDRADTALTAMDVAWKDKQIPEAVIVPVLPLVDDIAAGHLAGLQNVPLLRSNINCLSPQTWDALRAADVGRRTLWASTAQARAEAAFARCGSYRALPAARHAGPDAAGTAVDLSKKFHTGQVDTVILVGRTGVADGLAAAPLAARLAGPILVTTRNALPASTKAELTRLAPRRIIVVGGPAVVSETVVRQAISVAPVRRLGGASRIETAEMIAREFGRSSEVFVAGSAGIVDALPASVLAVRHDAPVILAPPDGHAVASSLKTLGARNVTLVGGEAVLGATVVKAVQASTGTTPTRLGGADRYATARLIATRFPGAHAYVLAGHSALIDAMSSAPMAGRSNTPLLYATPSCTRPEQADFLSRNRLVGKVVVGGASAISTVEANYVCGRMRSVPHSVTTCEPLWRPWNATLPASVRPWCPAGGLHGPVTSIAPTYSGQDLKWGWNGTKVGLTQRTLGLGSRWETMDLATVNAVRRFQSRVGLPATGVVDRATWNAMGTGWSWDIDAWKTGITVPSTATRQQRIEAMIAFAMKQRGSEYTWGGAGPYALGYDCSGLVLQSLYAAGLDPRPIDVMKHQWPDYRTSRELAGHPKLKKVPWAQMQRGDLVFYHSNGVVDHVAIYLGGGQMIEAGGNALDTHVTSLRWGNHWGEVVRPFP